MVNNKDSHLLSFVWLLLFILPSNNLFYLFVPISFVLLYLNRDRDIRSVPSIIWMLIISLFTTILLNFQEDYVQSKDIARVIALIILFFTFAKLYGSRILKPYIIAAVFFLVLSQFAFVLNVSWAVNFIKSYYPYEGDRDMYSYLENYVLSDFGSQRLGGIFYNSNEYARFIQLILITLLCEIKQFRKIELQVLIPLIVFSIAATGSRTSFLVLIAIGLSYFYFNKKITVKNVFLIGFIGVTILFYLFSNTNIGEFRMFKIDEGMDNSFGIKVGLLDHYLENNQSLLTLFFGNLSGIVTMNLYGFSGTDFDVGNIPIFYGYSFFILFLIFCIVIYKRMMPRYRIIFPILLWMFSNSIICNYRSAPIFLLLLGLYFNRSKNELYAK